MQFKLAVYIGRFQPFHLKHLETCLHGLELAERLLIFVGSANAAPDFRNPWSPTERTALIVQSLLDAKVDLSRVIIKPIDDFYTSDNMWVATVQGTVDSIISPECASHNVCLIGCEKDETSYYINYFKYQWPFQPIKLDGLNATDIRENYFLSIAQGYRALVPKSVSEFLDLKRKGPEWHRLKEEWEYCNTYEDKYGKGPHVTVDPVVFCRGHVLLIERKSTPGKGLLALPGGFLGRNERILDGTLRELREETKLKVPTNVLQGSARCREVFDHPLRDRRSRIITHATLFVLNEAELPKVKAASDAKTARWYPLDVALKDPRRLYSDHWQILNYMKEMEHKR